MLAQGSIAPVHRLSLSDFGSEGASGVVPNPLGSTAYVHLYESFVDPIAVAVVYWPWILTPAGVIIAALIVSRIRAVLARPQRPGVPHCRGCNYEVGATLASSPDSTPPECPECGHALTPRSIVRGRSTRRRLAPLAVPLALLAVGVAIGTALSLGWRPPLPAYPSPLAQRVVDRFGVLVPNTFLVDCSTIIEADLTTGATLRTVVRRTPPVRAFDVTPAGDTILLAEDPFLGVVAISTSRGRELRRLKFPPLPPRARGLARAFRLNSPICGFSADGSSAYILVPDLGPPVATSVVRWNLADGSISTIVSVPAYRDAMSIDRPRRAIVLRGSPDRVLSWPGRDEVRETQRQTFELRTGTGAAQIAADIGTDYLDVKPSALTADGSRLFLTRMVGDERTGGARAQLTAVSASTLRPLETIEVPWPKPSVFAANDPGSRFVAVAGENHVALWEGPAASSTWTPLEAPADVHSVLSVAFSGDGRFLIALGVSGVAPNLRGEVLVWDITSLRTRPRSPSGN